MSNRLQMKHMHILNNMQNEKSIEMWPSWHSSISTWVFHNVITASFTLGGDSDVWFGCHIDLVNNGLIVCGQGYLKLIYTRHNNSPDDGYRLFLGRFWLLMKFHMHCLFWCCGDYTGKVINYLRIFYHYSAGTVLDVRFWRQILTSIDVIFWLLK